MRCIGCKICHNVTRTEHASRKKCFVTLSPVFQGDKNGNVLFAFTLERWLHFTVRKWKETLTSSRRTFWQVTRRWWKENRLKMTPVAVFFNRFRMGSCVTLVRGIASKTIDFLLQFILQQPLLSLLTITVGGDIGFGKGGKLMVTSVHCSAPLPNMGIENWWRPFSQVVSHQMGEGF